MANPYSAALDQAKTELKTIQAEVQRLLARKSVLENLVKTLMSVSGNYEVPTTAAGRPAGAPIYIGGLLQIPMNVDGAQYGDHHSLWKQMSRVLKKRPSFTISEAGEAIEEYRDCTLGHTRAQQVRNSLIRHPETFRRNSDGTFTVLKEVD